MNFKTIRLNTGKDVTLWLDESDGRYILDKRKAEESESNFQKYIVNECLGTICSRSRRTSILEYYNDSTNINKAKIKEMINQDTKKIELVYNLVLESIINKKRVKK